MLEVPRLFEQDCYVDNWMPDQIKHIIALVLLADAFKLPKDCWMRST